MAELLRLREQLDTEIRRERAFLARFASIAGHCEAALGAESRDPDQTLARIAAVLEISVAELVDHSRRARLTACRQVAAWVLRQDGFSLVEIGRALDRDHTTARYSIRKVEADEQLRTLAVHTRAAVARSQPRAVS